MDGDNDTRFTLHPGQWYAAELIGDEFFIDADYRSYSAIRVDCIAPAGRGQRRFVMSFYHANYPEGVRDKVYTLQTLERTKSFIIARSAEHAPIRVLLIYDISWPWLRLHFGIEQPSGSENIMRWLSSNV